jgi:hypothetical protein
MTDDVKVEEKPKIEVEIPKIPEKTPIEEARYLMEENKKFLKEMQEERKKMELAAANMMIEGIGFQSKSKVIDAEQEKKDRVNKFLEGTGLKI